MHETIETPQPEYELRAKLFKKLHAVMADVQYIQKDAANDFHRYRYASEAAIKSALHKAFVNHGVIFLLSVTNVEQIEAADTAKGKKQWITRVCVEYEFTDTDTGYSVLKFFAGQGIDSEDKGIWKGITGAIKYILTSAFLIETGDDPEAESDQGQRVKAAQQRSIDRAAEGVGKGAKGYDKKAAVASILRERDRLIELAGGERGEAIIDAMLKERGWLVIDDDAKLSDRAAAIEMYKALAGAVLEVGGEQSDADPDPAKRKSEAPPKPEKSKPTTGKFAWLWAFQELKKEYGTERYHTELGACGYEHSNDIPVDKREGILTLMRETLKPMEVKP